MAKRSGQKLKLLYLMKILLEQTDEDHGLTISQLAQKLEEWGVSAERKSLYDDLETLRVYGLDVISPQGRGSYGVGSRLFEVAELKLLVDAVQSSRFITAKKSRELIGKVESLASVYQAQTLQRQVYVANRIKTMNESIYYNIDALHQAIAQGQQISFRYFQWAVGEAGEDAVARRFRREGERYQVSPWALTWDDENYYLVAYDTPEQKIKHFRVDKMEGIRLEKEKRDGAEQFQKFDMAVYSRQVFGMYGGYSPAAAYTVVKKLEELKSALPEGNEIRYVQKIDNVLFCHGGITEYFVKKVVPAAKYDDVDEVVRIINGLPREYMWRDVSPIWHRPQYAAGKMYGEDKILQVVGHTPVEEIYREGNVISCDVFSTYRDGRAIGTEEFAVVETERWEYVGEVKNE